MSGEYKTIENPQPEVLKPQDEVQAEPATPDPSASDSGPDGDKDRKPATPKRSRRGGYKLSHKATFIGIGVIVVILAINVFAIMYFLRDTSTAEQINKDEVIISTDALDKLGVSKTAVGNLGTELIVGPDSRFNSKVTIAGNVSIAGQLQLNSKFSASDASLAKLQAGDTALQKLNVNGESSLSTVSLRNDLNVTGQTKLQGTVTISQLLTVNNNLNVTGSMAVGGTLSVRNFQASSLTSDTTLVIGGHIITRGNAPGVSGGGALGSNGTVSISGNDASGTIGVNIGVGASPGLLAQVSFRNQYGNTPHVMVSAVGRPMNLYINRTSTGFSVYTGSALPPGGYAVDFVVMQ